MFSFSPNFLSPMMNFADVLLLVNGFLIASYILVVSMGVGWVFLTDLVPLK